MLGSGLIPESISARAGSLELHPGLLRGWVSGARGLGPSFAAFSDALSRKLNWKQNSQESDQHSKMAC